MSKVAGGRFDSATDPLRPFVPRIAVDWLRDAPAERAQRFDGTLVFADISGFTDLTEALAKRGREGAEEIAGVVDAAFGELIRRAYAHHADLLKFGGDAVLLLFRGENHPQRAAAAAVGMQEALTGMRRRSTSAGPVRLQMSIGIHSGAFHFFLVGGIHRELIVAGADATACVATEAIARAGEIALSAETARLFDPQLLGESRDGAVLLAHGPRCRRSCRRSSTIRASTSPSCCRPRTRASCAARRPIPSTGTSRSRSRSCADTDELLEREGPEALAAALDESITAIQESCLRYDVTFAQTDVSNGAVKAILLAGAPRTAGGEEEELMLRAARAIVERPGALPVRIGVNTGRVFAGIVGTLDAADVHVLRRRHQHRRAHHGARRRRAAAGTRGRARTRAHDLRDHADRAVRGEGQGRAHPGLRRRRGRRRARAGGDRPVRRARGRARRAARGAAAAAEGPGCARARQRRAGLGKTRLLGELCAQAAGVRTLRVQCTQAGANHPYSAAGVLLLRALELDRHAPAQAVERRLRALVPERAPELEPWIPLLALVVGLALPPTPECAALEESFVSERIAASVEVLLDALVPDAALFVVDDAHSWTRRRRR